MTQTLTHEASADADELPLRTAGDGRLVALVNGRAVAVRLRQCFPWSEPGRQLSLRDDEDREVALIDDPGALEEESRRALEVALADAGFVLEVARVVSIEEQVEIRQWTVETVHGGGEAFVPDPSRQLATGAADGWVAHPRRGG